MLNMDDFPHRVLKHRLDVGYFQMIEQVPPGKRGDMIKLWQHARDLYTELDKEMVNCRRRQKLTPAYHEIEAKLLESLNTFDQYLMWANLLTPNGN